MQSGQQITGVWNITNHELTLRPHAMFRPHVAIRRSREGAYVPERMMYRTANSSDIFSGSTERKRNVRWLLTIDFPAFAGTA